MPSERRDAIGQSVRAEGEPQIEVDEKRASQVGLESHRGARRPERLVEDGDVVEGGRAGSPRRHEWLNADAWRVDGAPPQDVHRQAERRRHAHVGAQGVKHQVWQIGLLPGLDVAGRARSSRSTDIRN